MTILICGVKFFKVHDDGEAEELYSSVSCNHMFIEPDEEMSLNCAILLEPLPQAQGVYAITFVASVEYRTYRDHEGLQESDVTVELVYSDVRLLTPDEAASLSDEPNEGLVVAFDVPKGGV